MTALLTCAKYGFQNSFKALYKDERVNRLATNYKGQNCLHLAVLFHNNHIVKVRIKMKDFTIFISKKVLKRYMYLKIINKPL